MNTQEIRHLPNETTIHQTGARNTSSRGHAQPLAERAAPVRGHHIEETGCSASNIRDTRALRSACRNRPFLRSAAPSRLRQPGLPIPPATADPYDEPLLV
jgi:hypothetical protein